MTTVEVQNISKSFKTIRALRDISFSVDQGELFGFIGPDGAGKTTLFRILTTLLLQDEGNARVCGFDTVKDYKNIRNLVGYMPGKFSLYPDLTVEENLHFFAGIFGVKVHENYYLIKEIYSQIEPFKSRKAGKLSGGMKQKLALSCALIHKPEVLFLDEPTTGVDAVSRTEFWEMLKRLLGYGITIIVSTPYMDEASRCDSVALIQQGCIMEISSPAIIVGKYPKKIYSLRSEGAFRMLSDLRKIAGDAYAFGNEIHFTMETGGTKTVIPYLESLGYKNISFTEIKPDIEDCFMELMSK